MSLNPKPAPLAGRRCAPLALVALLAVGAGAAGAAQHQLVLVDPVVPIEGNWSEKKFGMPTRYRLSTIEGVPAIEARGRGTASGLIRDVRFRVRDYPRLEWSWRVDRLPSDADIRTKSGDDVGASLFLVFGRPGIFEPQPPTLVYAWTSAATPEGNVVVSPHHEGTVRTLVLRSGEANLATWVAERRNLVEDFRLAFGRDPPEHAEAIALWSDSDQSNQEVRAYYGKVVASSGQ